MRSRPLSVASGRPRVVAPVKRATWQWYVPIYFWSGGLAAGAWLAAACEDLAGAGDRRLIRAGRYVSLGGILAGTALLIADLGRPERFLNMLRIVRARSTMSLGSWGLATFGAWCGAAALLQALEDGALGNRPALARLSRGRTGRAIHATGLPLALFTGSYTGVLLGTTSTPSWARRAELLGPLFASSAVSTGMASVVLALELSGGAERGSRGRLARAESMALATELWLALRSRRRTRALPSARGEGRATRLVHLLTLGAGMALPLLLQLRAMAGGAARPGSTSAAAWLTLAGGLSLRFLITQEGYRSALSPDDSWAYTGGEVGGGRGPALLSARAARRPERGRSLVRSVLAPRPRRTRVERGEIRGRITIVQEDRFRVVDSSGRGYLFTLARRHPSPGQLQRWRDSGATLKVRYSGEPDAGARAERITELS